MRIIKKKIDTDYFRFFLAYCESLMNISNDEWDYHNVSDSIHYSLIFHSLDYNLTTRVPDGFKKAEYFYNEDTGSMVPPDCCWISNSGKFSCHHLDGLLGKQAFILWDLERRVALPLVFHDLEGIDEEYEIIFCRTMSPIHRHGYSSAMVFNPEWIDILLYCISTPSEYPPGKESVLSDDELFEIARKTITPLHNELDILSFTPFPYLPELSEKNIRLLDQEGFSEPEKKNLAGEILFHPEYHIRDEDWVFDALFGYTEDMEKCRAIALWFGFEDIVIDAYKDWREEKESEAERNRKEAIRRNKYRDVDDQNEELPF